MAEITITFDPAVDRATDTLVGDLCAALHRTGRWPLLVSDDGESMISPASLADYRKRHGQDLVEITVEVLSRKSGTRA